MPYRRKLLTTYLKRDVQINKGLVLLVKILNLGLTNLKLLAGLLTSSLRLRQELIRV
jgi:hypothetical protein